MSALGVLCYLAHDTRGEEACWERCLALDPANALAYSRLFSLAEQEANYQRIVDLAHEAEARDPRNVAYRGRLGSALMYLQRYEEAKAVLEQHVNDGHGDADTYLVLGEVWYQLDEPRKAKRYFEAAAALAPYNSAMFFSLAKACAKLGETELATRYRAKFQELKDAETAAQKGETSARQQVRDEVHIPIRVSEIMRYVGKAYQEANELELAEKSWLRGAELNPDDTVSRELLSDLYRRQGRLEEALKWVRELKRIAPENRLHDRNEGLFLSRLKRYDEAEQVFRDLCRREPTGSSGYAALAELLVRRGGNVSEAQSLAERAVDFEPSGANLFLLAIVAHQAGDLTTARGPSDKPWRANRTIPSIGGCMRRSPTGSDQPSGDRWRWAIVGLGVVAIAGFALGGRPAAATSSQHGCRPVHRPRPRCANERQYDRDRSARHDGGGGNHVRAYARRLRQDVHHGGHDRGHGHLRLRQRRTDRPVLPQRRAAAGNAPRRRTTSQRACIATWETGSSRTSRRRPPWAISASAWV